MPFAHDTNDALRGAAALVNTAEGAFPDADGDTLSTTAALADFVAEWSWTGRLDGDERELEEVRSLRPRLRAVWEAGSEEERVALVNDLLRTGEALPQLVDHDGYGWHIHATEADAPLARRMQVEAAMAFVDGEIIRGVAELLDKLGLKQEDLPYQLDQARWPELRAALEASRGVGRP